MNVMQRNEYWSKVERMRLLLDRKYSSLFYEAIDSDLKQFARDVEEYGPEAAMSRLGTYAWSEGIMNVMNQLYREAAVKFGNASYRAVGQMNRKAADPFGLDSTFIDEILTFLTTYGFWLVSLMTQTTKKRLSAIIVFLIGEGKTKEEIAQAIRDDKQLEELKRRGVMIARTETMRSSNYIIMQAANKHPFEVDKVWVSKRDGRTRRIPKDQFDHWEMDGQRKAWNEPFVSTDKFGRTIVADMPGDPNTPRGFTINCRCTVAFVPRRDENNNVIMKR